MRQHHGVLFVLPAIIVLAMLIAYPIVYTGLLSVTDRPGDYVGLKNYAAMASARVTTQAVWNTAYYVLGSIVFQVMLGTLVRHPAQPEVPRPRPRPLAGADPVGRAGHRRRHHLGVDVPHRVRDHQLHADRRRGVDRRAGRLADQPQHRHAGADRDQRLEALPLRRGDGAGRPADGAQRALRGGARRRRELSGTRSATSCCRRSARCSSAITLLLLIWGLNAITIIYTITRGGPANRTLITPIQIFRQAFELFQFNQAAALSVMFFAVTIVFVAIYIRRLRRVEAGARHMKTLLARAGRSIYLGAALLLAVCVFPFVWMALSSVKTLGELYTVPPVWLPEAPTLENYRKVLFDSNVPRYFLNSTVISLGATAIALVLAIFASYGFARFHFRGKPACQAFILVGQLLPTAAIIVPLFITLRVLGLVNTYLGLILVYMILTLPLSVWMLTSYFRAIPVELEEAAIIDGASRLGVLFRITLPLSLPGIVAIVVYAFVTTWNEFIFALVLAQDCRVKTLPIGIAEFTTEFNTDWGAVMAASLIMTLPIALLFLAMQRLFVGGLTAGAVKG